MKENIKWKVSRYITIYYLFVGDIDFVCMWVNWVCMLCTEITFTLEVFVGVLLLFCII